MPLVPANVRQVVKHAVVIRAGVQPVPDREERERCVQLLQKVDHVIPRPPKQELEVVVLVPALAPTNHPHGAQERIIEGRERQELPLRQSVQRCPTAKECRRPEGSGSARR